MYKRQGFIDAFVTKLGASGSSLAYSTYLGGDSTDVAHGIAVDVGGSAYVTGSTFSGGFPTTPGAFQTSQPSQDGDGFVAKLSPTGSGLAYSTYVGGAGTDVANAIAVDGRGNAQITGEMGGVFVSKLTPAGSELADSAQLGGGEGQSIALDAAGSTYVTGHTSAAGFPTTPGAFDRTVNGDDAFVTKLSLNQCADGRDNDGDGRVDFPADPGCSSVSDDDERDPGPPPSTPGCRASGGGRLTADNGDNATFSLGARVSAAGVPSGTLSYTDHGPSRRLKVDSVSILAVTCDVTQGRATILGRATVNGSGSFAVRLGVVDRGEPGRDDHYSLSLSNGYASGTHRLDGGNIQVR